MEKVQADVKFVPEYCVTGGKKYYQYTVVDECTRFVIAKRMMSTPHTVQKTF